MISDWNPPRACKEVEDMISRIQEKFDEWKPPRFMKDNLSPDERKLLREIRNNDDIVYMWEDKGPSFVKMTREQYLQAGEKELSNRHFYQEVGNDPCANIKQRNDIIADAMVNNEEIPEKVGSFLKDGNSDLSKFYHLLKTHKSFQQV